jgi:hypothetical protein
MNSVIALSILIFAPAVLALAYSCYSMARFVISRRGATLKSELAVGVLGMFALFAPKLLTSDSKKYFTRFLLSAVIFCFYSAALIFVVSTI